MTATEGVADLAAARQRRAHRLAARRALPRDPDEVLTEAARALRAIESRAAEVERDARTALDRLHLVHDYLMSTRDVKEAQ